MADHDKTNSNSTMLDLLYKIDIEMEKLYGPRDTIVFTPDRVLKKNTAQVLASQAIWGTINKWPCFV